MPFKPGQSGNPKGRPKKGLALTDLLEKELNKTALDIDGRRHQNKRILARVAVEAATTGSVTFVKLSPTGEPHNVTQRIDPRDWMTWAKYIIDRVDGPPKQRVDVTTDDESLNEGARISEDRRDAIIAAIFERARDRADSESGDQE
jgi:hypothetical protein